VTVLLATSLTFLAACAVYLAVLVARFDSAGSSFSDAGSNLPGWAVIFAMAGIVPASVGLADHLSLIARFGLQASHIVLGLVLAALATILVQKRLWIAARIAGYASPGDALGSYYQSVTVRLATAAVAILFAVPFTAHLLSSTAFTVAQASGGEISRATAVFIIGFFLFLPAILGGWRATILAIAVQSAFIAVLLSGTVFVSEVALGKAGFLQGHFPLAEGALADRIPGVVQFAAGIGKAVPVGGPFTALGITSGGLSLVGIVLSPAFLYLGMTSRPGRALAFTAVWLIGGLAAGLLLVAGPILGARLAQGVVPLSLDLAAVEPFAGLALVLVVVVSSQIAISFFIASGAILVTRDIVLHYVLPDLSPQGARLAARIAIAIGFALVIIAATFFPLLSAVLASLALPLSVQLLPAVLGLTFVPWISRSAVLAGLIVGSLLVFFTEPPGLILLEGMFLNLPWGRWPLTVHSSAWGLAFNACFMLLVAIFTRSGEERAHRDRLHDEFAQRWRVNFGSPAARTAKWSLTLIWTFFALGPGAVLGNTFFSRPLFTQGEAPLGIPSLWAWQIFFWLMGMPLIWWLAYGSRLGILAEEGIRRVSFDPPNETIGRPRAPAWIASSLSRVTER
jgi:solute:Na+ symporter, SSS family